MSTFTDARDELVAAFTAAGLTAYGYTPATLIPPVVTIDPDDPWIAPGVLGESVYIRLQATVSVSLIDPGMAQAQLEDVLTTAIWALPPGWLFEAVDSPESDSTGSQGEVLSANLHVMALITFPPPVIPVPPSAPGLPVAVNWSRAEPGWYTFTLTWNPSADEGSSPILYYRVNIDGNESPTDGNVTQADGLRAEAGQTANAYVYAVNSEAVGPPSETSYLTAPPY